MRPNKPYAFVLIDKEAQTRKREYTRGGVMLHPDQIDMTRNLQYGKIIAYGEYFKRDFPQVQEGDTALFHHFVESNEDRLIEVLPNGDEIRWIRPIAEDMYGIVKHDGNLIPQKEHIFLSRMITPVVNEAITELSCGLEASYWLTNERLQERIDELQVTQESIANALDKWISKHGGPPDNDTPRIDRDVFEATEKEWEKVVMERSKLTDLKNMTRLTWSNVMHINEETTRLTGVREDDRIMYTGEYSYGLDVSDLYIKFFVDGEATEEDWAKADDAGQMVLIRPMFLVGKLDKSYIAPTVASNAVIA
jgi:hypothetical protein